MRLTADCCARAPRISQPPADSPFYFDSCLHAGRAQASAITSPRSESKNKALVLDAFDTLFNKRDYVAAARYWSPNYIQHSAHIEPGRDGLFNLVKSIPSTLKYEPGVIVAEGDLVIIYGRFLGFSTPVNWIAADILTHQGRNSRRALGCHSRRSDAAAVQKRKSDVR
jgi:predicted SnoaL-like aldol condensation-catalyzing enzyme